MWANPDKLTVVPCPAELETMALARARRAQGLTLAQVAEALTEAGHVSRAGTPLRGSQVAKWLDKPVLASLESQDGATHGRRPTVRLDCLAAEGGGNAARPCVYSACRYHLDTSSTSDTSGTNCTLDLVDDHPNGMTLEEVAAVLHVTKQRVAQIEADALAKLARMDRRVGDPHHGLLKGLLEGGIASSDDTWMSSPDDGDDW